MPPEVTRAEPPRNKLLVAGLFLLLFTSGGVLYTLGASVGGALFISSLRSESVPRTLPWVYVGASVANAAFALAYDRLAARLQRTGALISVQAVLAFAFSAALAWCVEERPSHYYLLTIALDAASLLSLTLFFGFVADYFNPREARKLYTFLGGGIAVGTVIGGHALSGLVPVFGVANMVYVFSGLLAFNAALCAVVTKVGTPEEAPREHAEQGSATLTVLIQHPFVRLIWLTFILGMLLTVASAFQMQWMASAMPRSELAAFLGDFYAWVGAVELGVQFLVVPLILRVLGVVLALAIPPVLVGAASGVMQSASLASYFGATALGYSAVVNGVRLTMEETLTLPARELLFLPLPPRIRSRAQTFAGAVLAPIARGLGGLALLAYVAGGWSVETLSSIVMICAGLLMLVVLAMRAPYRQALMESLQASGLGDDNLERALSAPGAHLFVGELLRSGDPAVLAFTLEHLERRQIPGIVSGVKALCQHPSPQVVARALTFLSYQADPSAHAALTAALGSQHAEVVSAAILGLARVQGESAQALLLPFIHDERAEVADAALLAVAPFDQEQAVRVTLTEMVAAPEPALRARTIRSIEQIARPEYAELLAPLLRSSAGEERRAAAQAMASCGSTRHLPLLIDAARRGELAPASLAAFGEAVLRELGAFLVSASSELERRHLLQVATHVAHPGSLDILCAELASSRDALTRALAADGVRVRSQGSPPSEALSARIERLIEAELPKLNLLLDARAFFAREAPGAASLFGDHAQVYLDALLSLAGAYMSSTEFERMQASLAGSSESQQASALELLDAALPRGLAASLPALVQRARRASGTDRPTALGSARLQELSQLDPFCAAALAHAQSELKAAKPSRLSDPRAEHLSNLLPGVFFLKRVPLFAGLGADYALELCEIAQPVSVRAGQRLFDQGDPGEALYVVFDGALSVQVGGSEVALLSAGQPLGELALLDGEPRSASAVATAHSRLLRLPAESFQKRLSGEAWLSRAMLSTLYNRLHGSTEVSISEHPGAQAPGNTENVALPKLVSTLSTLRETPLLAGLGTQALVVLAEHAKRIAFEAGQVVYGCDDLADALYVVCSGAFAVRGAGAHGEISPGQVFGEGALIGRIPRKESAKTVHSGQLLSIDATVLRQVLDADPALGTAALRLFAGRLRAHTAASRRRDVAGSREGSGADGAAPSLPEGVVLNDPEGVTEAKSA